MRDRKQDPGEGQRPTEKECVGGQTVVMGDKRWDKKQILYKTLPFLLINIIRQ